MSLRYPATYYGEIHLASLFIMLLYLAATFCDKSQYDSGKVSTDDKHFSYSCSFLGWVQLVLALRAWFTPTSSTTG